MPKIGLLSVIIPAYNEEAMIKKAQVTIGNILSESSIPFEIIFVDDGSEDETWLLIQEAAATNTYVRGFRFSRNFGKEAAIMSGLQKAHGECCIVIDCDLQHPPEKMIEMYSLWKQGYEIVEGRKATRGTEKRIHTAAAKTFYSAISSATGMNMENTSDFKLLDRKAVNALMQMREYRPFFRALSSWIGFKSTYVEFDVQTRPAGKSKWSSFDLAKYALSSISSFSTVPMQIVTVFGAIMLLISMILGGIALYQKLCGYAAEGFTTVILIQLFSCSLIMMSIGIVGYYIARIFDEVKGRPRYIIAETCGDMMHERTTKQSESFSGEIHFNRPN